MKTLFKMMLLAFSGAILAVVGAYLRFQRMANQEARDLFANARKNGGGIVTADMLKGLPEPVQRYLTYSGILGKPFVQTVRLKQVGRFRRSADEPWMNMTAEEYFTVAPPGLVWNATFWISGLPMLRGFDRYRHGQGNMQGKIAAIFPIFDVKGEKLTQGTMLRYLNEMTWFPSAFLGENITWRSRDDNSADVTFTDHGKSVTATLFFDAQGKLTNFVAQRYREVQGDFHLDTWSTPMDVYGELAGLQLPIRGRAVWHLSTGDLPYAELQITEIEYNNPVLYSESAAAAEAFAGESGQFKLFKSR